MDDVIFSYHGANRPESCTTFMFRSSPGGGTSWTWTATVFGHVYQTVHQGKVCYLCFSEAWFPLFQEFEIQGLFKDLSMTFQVPFHDIFKDLPVYCYR